jgi:hypothetical protein
MARKKRIFKCSKLIFGRCSVRNSSGAQVLRTGDFRGFPQPFYENVEIVPLLGHDQFPPNPYQFIIHQSSYHSSVVAIATGYGLDDRGAGFRVPVGSRIFFSPRRPDQLCGPPNLLSNWLLGALSPGVKRQGREAENSPPASAEVKKMWIYTSTPTYAFKA